MSYTNNRGAGQPAHQRSLIGTVCVRSLDCIPVVSGVSGFSWAGWFEFYLVENPRRHVFT